MSGRRAIIGLCMLCALAVSAIAAQGASAAPAGTTLFTCVNKGAGGGFTREHCAKGDVGSGNFWHVAIAENTTTEITGTTINTAGEPITSKLESVQSGVVEELQGKLGHILAEHESETEPPKIEKSWVINAVDPETKEHYYHGENWLRFTEVEVTKPAGKGCKVKNGEVTTRKLKFTSKGQGDELLFKPAKEPTPVEPNPPFATFVVEGCSIGALNHEYTVTGEVKAETDGATVKTTLAGTKAQGTLKVSGQVAGFQSEFTVRGTDKAAGDKEGEDKPLSPTTVETP